MPCKLTRVPLLGFLLYALLGLWPASGQSTSPDVSVTGSISSHAIRKDELLQFTLTVKNRAMAKAGTGNAINALTLWKLPDSYALDDAQQICLLPPLPPRTNPCLSAHDFSAAHNLLADSLGPGESLTVHGYLKPTAVHKTSTLIAVVNWYVVEPGKPPVHVSSSLAASLGESQVQSTSWLRWPTFDEFMKILAVPALLLVIGAITGLVANWVNSRRDTRIAAAQAAAQERRHEHEQIESIRAETWKQMLLVSHKYAAECYLPLSLAADRLADNLEALSGPSGNQKVTFYYALLCGKRMAKTRKETGGFYFKDLRGEALAARCWKKFRDTLLGTDEDAPFYVATFSAFDTIADIETYQAFKKKYEIVDPGVTYNDSDIESAWTLFLQRLRTHAAEIPEVVRSLRGFSAALDYESNRPYKYWYDIRDKLTLTPELAELFRDILRTDGRFTEEQVNKYIAGTDSDDA